LAESLPEMAALKKYQISCFFACGSYTA